MTSATVELLESYADVVRWLRGPGLDDAIVMANVVRQSLRSGGTLFIAGNGGSAADAQHVAAEYVGAYAVRARKPMRAVAAVLTAVGNDYGFEDVFARQLRALARPGDVCVLHSTSGTSKNVARAAATCIDLDVRCFALLGPRTRCRDTDVASHARPIYVPAWPTGAIQAAHMMLHHVVAGLVEASFVADWAPIPPRDLLA